ncbi:MAG: DUF5916 domain-containing protein [Candidatus Omnitrophota bacterium]
MSVVMSVIVVLIMMAAISDTHVFSAESASEEGLIHAVKAQGKPRIDGVLDDEVWQTMPIQRDFITYYPVYGEKLPFNTEFWAAYDNKNLYFAFRCSDPNPSKLQTSITRRDKMYNDDWVAVAIDTAGNGQSAYVLYVNPNGIQGDTLTNFGMNEDSSPDIVWESAAKITDKGYQVEICLPLRSIGYKSGENVKMGILVKRKIVRTGFEGSWPDIKLGHNIVDSQSKVIYKDLKTQLRLETLPSLTHNSNSSRINANEWGESDNRTKFGIDFKYGITSSITADVTINPDFSQVESDAFQVEVNQRYPLFYKEKRFFFMEGSDILKFYTFADGYLQTPVHTRRIVEPGWGVKLTGNAGKMAFGILSAGDKWPGQVWDDRVNPNEGKKAFFGIARGKYSLGQNRYVGFLYSGREFAGCYNRVFGTDFLYRLGETQRLSGSFLHSDSGDEAGRIGQGSRSNYGTVMYNYDTKYVLVAGAFEHIGADFRMDSSYLRRTGVNDGLVWLGYAFYPDPKKMAWLKMISPDFRFYFTHDLITGKNDSLLNLALYFFTTREGMVILTNRYVQEYWQGIQFRLTQYQFDGVIRLNKWLKMIGIYQFGDYIYYEGMPTFKGKGGTGSLTLTIQPNKKLNEDFVFTHADLKHAGQKVYDVNIFYSMTKYQFNKYFFVRAVIQYDSYEKKLLTDLLGSVTVIPGTVLHLGYGGLYENRLWANDHWEYRMGDLMNVKRSFFAKISYLWRF